MYEWHESTQYAVTASAWLNYDAVLGPIVKVTEKTFQEMYINVGMANCEK